MPRAAPQGLHDLCALWVDGDAMHMALGGSGSKLRAIVSLPTKRGSYPSVAAHHAPAMRLERAMRDLYGVQPIGLPDHAALARPRRLASPPPG